jgi:hypothetical protein
MKKVLTVLLAVLMWLCCFRDVPIKRQLIMGCPLRENIP